MKEVVAIFRNDFKPPKTLWIEKNAYTAEASAYNYNNASEALEVGNVLEGFRGEPGEERKRVVDFLEERILVN